MFSSISLRIAGSMRRAWSSATQEIMAIRMLNFAEVNAQLKNPNTILLDVREKKELPEDGKISGSNNIPVGEIANALKMNDNEFKQKYGFPKPSTNDSIVIHCKAGVRAQNAAKVLVESGFSNVVCYPGILDWVKNGGKVEK